MPTTNHLTSESSGYSPGQLELLLLVSKVVNILSIIGCLFNLSTTLFLKNTQYTLNKMVIGLSIMDILYNFTPLVAYWIQESEFLCQTYAFFAYTGYAGSLVWTCCFAHCLYRSIKQGDTQVVDNYTRTYFMVSTISGILFGGFVVAIRYYQIHLGEGGCLHLTEKDVFDWTDFIVSDLAGIGIVLYCGFCYLSVITKLRQFGIRMHLELMLYPLILVVCLFPWISYSLYNMIIKLKSPIFPWVLVANILASSQGLLNAFAYGLSSKIVTGYRNKCCNRRKSIESSKSKSSLLLSSPEEKITSSINSSESRP